MHPTLIEIKALPEHEKLDFALAVLEMLLHPVDVITALQSQIGLRQKEASILSCLMAGAGAPVSKGKIYLQVYGFESDTQEQTLDVHLSKLRSKIKHLAKIRTIHGAGLTIDETDAAVIRATCGLGQQKTKAQ